MAPRKALSVQKSRSNKNRALVIQRTSDAGRCKAQHLDDNGGNERDVPKSIRALRAYTLHGPHEKTTVEKGITHIVQFIFPQLLEWFEITL